MDTVYALCHAPDTVTSEVAQAPVTLAPGKVAEKLYSKHNVEVLAKGHGHKTIASVSGGPLKEEDLDYAAECGKFPTRPSDLFLKVSTAS